MAEQWLPVVGWESLYEVSNQGRVRSLHKPERPIFLRPTTYRTGHFAVMLYRDGKRKLRAVHRLVLLAFIGPAPEGLEGCHRDGVATNNRVDNLYWGTRSQNVRDAVAHGTHKWASRNHCSRGHDYTAENTRLTKDGHRVCRECQRGFSDARDLKSEWLQAKAERVDWVDHRYGERIPGRCHSGRHLWSEQDPIVRKDNGKKTCRPCRDERRAARRKVA